MDLERPQQIHPWKDFARADLPDGELEALPRTLRFALIQINKFWVEVQSFPLFMKALRSASVDQIEGLLLWLRDAPPWEELLPDARVVPELSRAASRRVLLDFAREVRCVNILREGLRAKVKSEDLDLLGEAASLVKRNELAKLPASDLPQQIAVYRQRLARLKGVMRFFEEFAEKASVPHARNPSEALQLFQMVDSIGRIPSHVVAWRHRQVLDPSKRIRIQTWQDRMRPASEARKRFEGDFRMDSDVDPDRLRSIAEALQAGGLFRSFKAEFKDAVKAYKDLLLNPNDKKHSSETPYQMAERLLEWADHLDQVTAFLENGEARGFFGQQYRGIDTHFSAALDANAWAAQVREEFDPEVSSFAEQVVDFLFDASKDSLDESFVFGTSSGAETIRSIVSSADFSEDREFVEYSSEVESKLAELLRLKELVQLTGFEQGMALGEFSEIHLLTDEAHFLIRRMDANASLKEWLKTAYRGPETDLRAIEVGLKYVKYVETATIPDVLKEFFLTPHGPSRLGENRKLVGSALASLALVKEHLSRLDAASGGGARALIAGPVPQLMERIQQALNQPMLLRSWIEELRREGGGRLHPVQ